MSDWTLHEIQDRELVCQQLLVSQLSPRAAETKVPLFSRAARALAASGLPTEKVAMACFVPGRIEVLGKHTDYAGGRSLVVAADRGFCLVSVACDQPRLSVTDVVSGESIEFPLDGELQSRPGHWSNYPKTVARRIARNFAGTLRGAHIAFASDLPPASGMSSSSALIVAIFLALSEADNLPHHEAYACNITSREDLAGYLATVENGQSYRALVGDLGVGTFGGSEDHTAILCARPGQISQYSYCPLRFERSIKLPAEKCFVVAVSGVAAEKTGSAMAKYNRASQLASAVADTWREATGRSDPHLAAAIGASTEAIDQLRELLRKSQILAFDSSDLLDRLEQFWAESEQLIPNVGNELVGDELARFGDLVDRSQELGARLLKNQVPETEFLARTARSLGADAASAFGAGFGGSVWALVSTDVADEFQEKWAAAYQKAFAQHAEHARFLASGAGPAAFVL